MIAIIMTLFLLTGIFTGCSSAEPEAGVTGQSQASQSDAQDSAGSELFDIVAVRPIPDDISFPDHDTLEDNVWTRLYASELGINLIYEWTTPAAQYDQRMNLALTSGKLPDIFQVNASQLKLLVDDERIADLSGIYGNHASEFTKSVMAQDGGSAMESATFGGKLMAIPKMGSGIGNTNVLWIRSDWLRNLGMNPPETMSDVIEIAQAFTKNDPDQNGANDTYGLALNKDLFGLGASLEGFMNGYSAYPGIWIEGSDGSLGFGDIQPEIKESLQALQNLYKDGCIDPEFGTKDFYTVVNGDAGRGNIGMFYGLFWNMGWLTDAKTGNADMEWTPYAVVGTGAGSAFVQVPFPIDTYYVVSADCERPEVAVEMLNLVLDRSFGENAQPEIYNVDSEGRPIFEYPLMYSEPPMKNLDAQKAVTAALASGDTSALNAEQKGYFDQVEAYRAGNRDEGWAQTWAAEQMWSENGSLAVINGYVSGGKLVHDRYFGPATESMASYGDILNQTKLQVYTEIIQGADINSFDEFVSRWKELGGEQITTEVNQWNNSR